MVPSDRLICAFVESKSSGFTFKEWLLHVTIVPWFRLNNESRSIAQDLETKLQEIKPFAVSMGRENIRFGYQEGKLATLVRLPSPLTKIEKRVRDYFYEQNAWLVDETTIRKRVFKPHITNQINDSLHEGDIFTCDRLYIVEQKGGFKELVDEVRFG